jgi:hypothetical protein
VEFVPHWLSIGCFVAILAVLVVIVWWEFKRPRDKPYFAAGAAKEYLAAERTSAPETTSAPTQSKRGFDW